ncbi:MAG: diaminopimelate epimerase [bacterium]
MQFSKMEGLGNDFVVLTGRVEVTSELVRFLCDRHFGIGADGVLRVGLDHHQVVMDYWNADGSEAEMCGSGLRCVARFAYEHEMVPTREFSVRTAVGERRVEALAEPRVELGPVAVGESFVWEGATFYAATVGNPHAVTVVEDPEKAEVARIGHDLEQATPGGVNVGFVAVEPEAIRLRVWERGVGETLACGSGMVAAAAVTRQLGLISDRVDVEVAGGMATVDLDGDTSWLTGPARTVFSGEIEIPTSL